MATAVSQFRMFKKFTTLYTVQAYEHNTFPFPEEQGPSLHLQLNDLKEQVPVLDVSAVPDDATAAETFVFTRLYGVLSIRGNIR